MSAGRRPHAATHGARGGSPARVLDDAAVLAFPLQGVQLIEASAGTGKTYSIANLYLRQILSGRDVGEVLVVTFTNAATDELRGRLRARLFEALALLEREGDGGDAFLRLLVQDIRARADVEPAVRRLRLAVRAMDEAAVLSIHSFCHRALTELAFNSGQGFGVEIRTDEAELKRAAVQDWWRRTAYPLDAAKARLLAEAVGGLEGFRAQLAPLLKPEPRRLLPAVNDVPAVLERLDPLLVDLRDIAAQWRDDGARLADILRKSKGLSQSQKSPYRPEHLEASLVELDAWLGCEPNGPPPGAFRALCLPAEFRLKKPDPALDDPFFASCATLAGNFERLRGDLRAAALADAAGFVRSALAKANTEARELSFDDLLTTLRDALAGPGGQALAAEITRRFPVAMIDEFQDTDPLQWEIFRRLYVEGPGTGLLLIGDPKQAIYSFRGGDIFTYMDAQRCIGDDARATLLTNWRSTPQVVGAVNAVFSRREQHAFVFGEAIGFAPSTAADKPHRHLMDGKRNRPALTLWTLPHGDDGKPLSKEDAATHARNAVAGEIVRLLAAARHSKARLVQRDASGRVQAEAPLRPADIAVLVRTHREGTAVRRALAERGVAAVSVAPASVYDSDEAAALKALMEAALNPRDRGLARVALASDLLGLGYAEMARIAADDLAWTDWVDRLLALGAAWQQRGFMAFFSQLLWHTGPNGLAVADRIAAGVDAERRLTNLLHLGELLQQAAREHAGMDALLGWFRIQRRERGAEHSSDDLQLRLESDAGLVQIVTVHAAKGLQYPVVFLPDLWNPRITRADAPIGFHDDGQSACLDIGSDERDAHLLLAERERLAEDVRIAYVALTRAQSAIYAVWGRAGQRKGHAGASALGWLLHPAQDAATLAEAGPDAFAAGADLEADLAALAAAAAGSIVVEPLPEDPLPLPLPPEPTRPALAPRAFRGRIATDWRIASFSALTRELHAEPPAAIAGSGQRVDDEAAPDTPPADLAVAAPTPADDDPVLRFPAGSDVGSFLHLLLEHLDFTGDVRGQAAALSARFAPRFGLDHRRHGEATALLLARVVDTALDDRGLRLADLPPARRLNELAFDLAAERADMRALNHLLADHAGGPLAAIAAADFAGMVTGVIDLVFEHDGRFFVADYKSNRLGPRFDDYAPAALAAAVRARRYDLQYLLYTLALHRYLRTRLPDYDYERHVGGVFYLFLRGMRPGTGPGRGVFFERPPAALIGALDREVFRFGATGGAS
jgi:exodeoxyribonuclease V beta subunit